MVVDLANFITQIKLSVIADLYTRSVRNQTWTYRPELMIGLFFKFHEMAWLLGWG